MNKPGVLNYRSAPSQRMVRGESAQFTAALILSSGIMVVGLIASVSMRSAVLLPVAMKDSTLVWVLFATPLFLDCFILVSFRRHLRTWPRGALLAFLLPIAIAIIAPLITLAIYGHG